MSGSTTPNLNVLFDTTQRLLRRGAVSNVKNILDKLHPTDLAGLLKRFEDEEQDQILDLLFDHPKLPNIFAELGGAFLEGFIKRTENYQIVTELLQKMASDDRTQLVGQLPQEMSDEILSRMRSEQSTEVTGLLQYEENTAGRLMSTEFFKLREDTLIRDTISVLNQAESFGASLYYIYIVDEFGNLTGLISLRQLFQGNHFLTLKDVMYKEVVSVGVNEKSDEVARIVAQYDLVAVPVVDESGKLKGIITVDDIIDVIQEEAAEKAFRMGDVEGSIINENTRFRDILKLRFPWFLILLLGGFFTCEIIDHYSSRLPNVGIFAGFIPMILRFGGVIARQTSTIVMQVFSTEDAFKKMGRVFWRQAGLALFFALLASALVAIYTVYRFPGYQLLPLSVAVALFSSMIMALFFGMAIPISLKKLSLDPAISTGSLVNFALDIFGLLIYFKVLIAMLL